MKEIFKETGIDVTEYVMSEFDSNLKKCKISHDEKDLNHEDFDFIDVYNQRDIRFTHLASGRTFEISLIDNDYIKKVIDNQKISNQYEILYSYFEKTFNGIKLVYGLSDELCK